MQSIGGKKYMLMIRVGTSARDGKAAKCQSHWHAAGVPRVRHSQGTLEAHRYDNGNTSS